MGEVISIKLRELRELRELHKQNTKHLERIYWKTLITYTVVLLGIVIGLETYFISSLRGDRVERSQSDLRIVEMEASNYIQQLYSNASSVEYAAYQVEDIEWFLKEPLEVYLKKKIDNYAQSVSTRYYGADDFVDNILSSESRMESISLLSNSNQKLSSYMQDGKVKTTYFETWELDVVPDKLFQINRLVVSKNFHSQDLRKSLIGNIIMCYDLEPLNDIVEKYGEIKLAVFDTNKRILFNTGDRKQLKKFLNRQKNIAQKEEWEHFLKSYVELNHVSDCWIIAYIPENIAASIPNVWWITLLILGVGLFALGEFLVHLYIKKLTNRMYVILNAMKHASEGKLDEHIHIAYERPMDELDIIAENFNQMCVDMNNYIEKSYLAEIAQKNAELCALQSQINPHFLYNTLEVIRMKAICNGDREVGRMLYSLAVIFRSQIKEDDIIPIAKELHYCKKYLELFEYRYHNKFSFKIECEEQLLERKVIKLIIQPIVENYFVHGIRLEEDDNRLIIRVFEEENDIVVHVSDNGKGMTAEEIKEKNEQLQRGKQEKGSIGIQNVHIRMKAAYGDKYGVTLKNNEWNGLCVVLRFPKEENKKCIK